VEGNQSPSRWQPRADCSEVRPYRFRTGEPWSAEVSISSLRIRADAAVAVCRDSSLAATLDTSPVPRMAAGSDTLSNVGAWLSLVEPLGSGRGVEGSNLSPDQTSHELAGFPSGRSAFRV